MLYFFMAQSWALKFDSVHDTTRCIAISPWQFYGEIRCIQRTKVQKQLSEASHGIATRVYHVALDSWYCHVWTIARQFVKNLSKSLALLLSEYRLPALYGPGGGNWLFCCQRQTERQWTILVGLIHVRFCFDSPIYMTTHVTTTTPTPPLSTTGITLSFIYSSHPSLSSSMFGIVAPSAVAAAAVASEWDTPFFSFKKQVDVVFDSDGHGALHAREFIPKGFVFWHGTLIMSLIHLLYGRTHYLWCSL